MPKENVQICWLFVNTIRLLTLLDDFIKGTNISTPKAFFTHENFALLIVHVPTNNSPVVTFTGNFTHQDTRAFEQQHQTGSRRFFNVELATHYKHTMLITVTVSPLESHFNGSKNYHDGSPRPMQQRFSFCMFVQEELFMPSSKISEKVSSVIVGIHEMNGTQITGTSSMEPIVITFIIPKVIVATV